MEEIKNTEPEIQPTIQVPVKKTRYWLWLGIIFAVIVSINLFGLPHIYHSQIPDSLKWGIYTVMTPIAHILFVSADLDGRSWVQTVAFLWALMVPKVPYISSMIFLLLPAWIYFLIGALIWSIIWKLKSNATFLAIFLLIISIFITYRLYTYKLKYYPSQSRDCLIYSTEFEQWACISQLAREKKDISMCKNVPAGSNYESDCYSMVAEEVREYGVCDKMPFWEEWRYPHKTACRDTIAHLRSECDNISTPEWRDACHKTMSGYIQQYAGLDKCNRFREILGWKPMIQLCDDFRSWKVNMDTLCEKIVDEKMKNECISQKPIGRIEFWPEKPEPVEWLYGPGTPETEEEIKNRPKPREEQIQNEIPEENWTTGIEENEEVIFSEPSCKDLDDGMVASKKWVIVMDSGKHFEDVCRVKTGESYKTATSCSGDSCYIEEGYCFAETTTPESLPTNTLPCPNGCNNGICKIDNTKEGTYTTFCNNIVRENDAEYQVWKDRIEKQFPGLYVDIMGAYCKINNGNTVVSFSYSSSSGVSKQRIALFNKRGQYIKFTDNLDCRFDSGNYFRFQNESNGLISMVCENNFTRGNWSGVYKKIISSTFYTLNLSTLESELMAEK